MTRPFPPLAVLFLALLGGASDAYAATTAIAVMPFRDLAGSKNPVGDGIRETVTSDLRGVPGVRVVERSEIERVLNEQKMQLTELDKDPLATMKLGKLIGADVITMGAYQQVGRRIRLTARFVKVETGEVTGSAKVDGDASDFLDLQDRITQELLKSAKLTPAVVKRFERRARPKIRSMRAVELLGQAAEEKAEPMKRALLKEALKEEPSFAYATDELARLEKRLKELNAKADEARKAEAAKTKEAWTKAKTRLERSTAVWQYTTVLREERRFREVIRVYRELASDFENAPEPHIKGLAPSMLMQAVILEAQIADIDGAVKDGEIFLTKFPTSNELPAVRSTLERIIERKKKIEAGKAVAAKEAAEITGERRWNLCAIGHVYERALQFPEARRLYLGCLEAGTDSRAEALGGLQDIALETGDWKAARKYDALIEEESPTIHEQRRSSVIYRLPIDD